MAGDDGPGQGPPANSGGNGNGNGASRPKHNYRGGHAPRPRAPGGGGGGGGGGRKEWERRDNRPTKRRRLWGDRDRNGEAAAAAAAAAAGGVAAEGDEAGERAARASNMSIPFSAEEIAAEERRPKRKVAVLLGYAGTGYRGMQINHDEKTIEGDLFAAFVAAGAIAKANADDPKKSSLVRCARTDKGVHAAGNVISLKLIVEDADVVARINAHLPPQIRVWGIQRTVNSFSCYQACDSRWYEYLLPSYALLPPHPDSFLGRQMVASARRADEEAAAAAQSELADDETEAPAKTSVYADMMARLEDVQSFWADVERDVVAPILDALDPEVRRSVVEQLHATDDTKTVGQRTLDELETSAEAAAAAASKPAEAPAADAAAETATDVAVEAAAETATDIAVDAAVADTADTPSKPVSRKLAVEQALRDIKAAYVAAKRRYRVTPARLGRLQEALTQFVGTRNFHNYTVQKAHGDASAKRHIKSFVVSPEPIQIGDTQWLSLKVHGQSFMMHQIRKMVAMAAMVTRCGTDPAPAMALSFGPRRISIPRAPGFGLLLERPVFDSYNARAQSTFGKAPLDFDVYAAELRAFKDREIYARIWDVEENQNVFHAFFHQLDNFRTSYYLWAIPGGYSGAFERLGGQNSSGPAGLLDDADEDNDNPEGGDG